MCHAVINIIRVLEQNVDDNRVVIRQGVLGVQCGSHSVEIHIESCLQQCCTIDCKRITGWNGRVFPSDCDALQDVAPETLE